MMQELSKVITDASKEISKGISKEIKNTNIDKRIKEGFNNLSRNNFENINIEKRCFQNENRDIKNNEIKKMEPQVTIKFKCPEKVDKKEFYKQLKGQERGLNKQTIKENCDNREAYQYRKNKTGEGRLSESDKIQSIQREKAEASRVKTNMEKGMTPSEAENEAKEWLKTKAALHNPDQIAGGNPMYISKMGDKNINSSIGAQWKTKVNELESSINEYKKNLSDDEISKIKLNFKLEMEE